jgi:predicted outer membrane lipoprotein
LERFFDRIGTSSEKEVRRVLGESKSIGADESVRTAFITWFTARYALLSAARLAWGSTARGQAVAAIGAGALSIAALMMFLLKKSPPLQVGFQISVLVILVSLAPDVFRILLPRAWLGSLVAWLTIVLTQTMTIFPFADTAPLTAQKTYHAWLRAVFQDGFGGWLDSLRGLMGYRSSGEWQGRAAFAAAILLSIVVAVAFVSTELHRRVFRRVVWRALGCVVVMLMGSLFWGGMLAHLVHYIIEKPSRIDVNCDCVFGAWLLGSCLAVVFGIVVQLIWDEQSLAGDLRESIH